MVLPRIAIVFCVVKKQKPPSGAMIFEHAIKDLTEEIQAITPIMIHFTTANFNEELLNDNLRLMLYRIVQEQVNNILKHAAASEIILNLETNHGVVWSLVWLKGTLSLSNWG